MFRSVGVICWCGLLAACLARCGGDSNDGGPTASIRSVPTVGESRTAPPRPERPRREEKQPVRRPSGDPGEQIERALDSAVANLAPAQRSAVVGRIARLVFSRYGFRTPGVTLTAGGRRVTLTMSSREACTATPRTEAQLAAALRKSVPWARAVRIQVVGANVPLSRFIASECDVPTLPSGRGRIVLEMRGTGQRVSQGFTVRSRRWAIEYLNGGRLLQVSVLKGRAPTGVGFRATGRGPGRRTLTGTGAFRLTVAGTGDWTLRVRDGS